MNVDDEEVMLKEVLQDLKGSLVSNVNQALLILGKARRCTCHCGQAIATLSGNRMLCLIKPIKIKIWMILRPDYSLKKPLFVLMILLPFTKARGCIPTNFHLKTKFKRISI
jgi:hypothetical protein